MNIFASICPNFRDAVILDYICTWSLFAISQSLFERFSTLQMKRFHMFGLPRKGSCTRGLRPKKETGRETVLVSDIWKSYISPGVFIYKRFLPLYRG